VVAISRDITERKRAEEARGRRRTPSGGDRAERGGHLPVRPDDGASSNRTGLPGVLGYTTDELLGMIIYDFIAHEASTAASRATTGKGATRASVSTAGRSLADVEVSATVVPYGARKRCCACHDITERKGGREALRKARPGWRRRSPPWQLGWDVRPASFWSDGPSVSTQPEPKSSRPTSINHGGRASRRQELVEKNMDGALHEDKPYEFERAE